MFSKEFLSKVNIQKHTVYPVHTNVFKIGLNGTESGAEELVQPKELETFEPVIDGNVEEWYPLDQEGWMRRLMTAKSLAVTLTGKRNYGDPGNDYLAGLALLTGVSTTTKFQWTLANGAVLEMDAVINVTQIAGGESTAVDTLEIEVLSDGKPTFTSVGLPSLVFVCEAGSVSGTQITSVVPTLTGGNTYKYKINGALPIVDQVLDGSWASYTLSTDIDTLAGNIITLVEVDGTSKAVKGGQSAAVTA